MSTKTQYNSPPPTVNRSLATRPYVRYKFWQQYVQQPFTNRILPIWHVYSMINFLTWGEFCQNWRKIWKWADGNFAKPTVANSAKLAGPLICKSWRANLAKLTLFEICQKACHGNFARLTRRNLQSSSKTGIVCHWTVRTVTWGQIAWRVNLQ